MLYSMHTALTVTQSSSDQIPSDKTVPFFNLEKRGAPRPTCSVSSNKLLYDLHDTKVISWTSTNATTIRFDDSLETVVDTAGELTVPGGTGTPPLPVGPVALEGTTEIELGGSGYNVIPMIVEGPGGVSHCRALFYVRGNGAYTARDVVIFGELPLTAVFYQTGDRASSQDGMLGITLETWSKVTSGSGVVTEGNVVLIIRDGNVEFPVFLAQGIRQQVLLSSGPVYMTLELVGKMIRVTVTK